jgi:hypothetical protein
VSRRGRARATSRSAKTASDSPPALLPEIAVVAIVAGLVVHARQLWFVCDDAFISFRYARNLVDGAGLVFNAGERVEGYTNFLWTLVSAAALALGARPETVVPVVSAVCAVATGALLAANSGYAAWATGGLETASFTLCVTALVLVLARALDRSDGRAIVATAPLALLVVLGRPDGHLVAGVATLALAWAAARGRIAGKTFGLWLALWLVPDALYQGWRVAYYGHVFPNSFALRGSGFSIAEGGGYVGGAIVRLGLWLWALPFLVLAVRRRAFALAGAIVPLACAVIALQAGFVALVGGDFMDLGRYLVPVLPLAAILAGAAWAQVVAEAARRPAARTALASAVLVAAVGLGVATSRDSIARRPYRGLDSIGLLRAYSHEWTLVGEHLSAVAAPSDSIAITAAGIVPYISRLYTIDELGLVAPDLASYGHRGVRRTGHARWIDPAHLRALRPQFLLDEPHLTARPGQLRTAFFASPEWARSWAGDYELVTARLNDPETPYYTFAVRKDVLARPRR